MSITRQRIKKLEDIIRKKEEKLPVPMLFFYEILDNPEEVVITDGDGKSLSLSKTIANKYDFTYEKGRPITKL